MRNLKLLRYYCACCGVVEQYIGDVGENDSETKDCVGSRTWQPSKKFALPLLSRGRKTFFESRHFFDKGDRQRDQ